MPAVPAPAQLRRYLNFTRLPDPALEVAPRQPRMDLYLPDQLHYLPPAYDRMTEAIKPVITAAWAELSKDGASRRE